MRIYHIEIPSRTSVAIQSEATFGFTNIFQTTKISSIYWNGIFTLNKFFSSDVCTSILPRSRLLVLTVVAEILNITVRFYRFTVVSQRFVRISFPENDYLLISVKIRNNRQTNSAATVFSQYK